MSGGKPRELPGATQAPSLPPTLMPRLEGSREPMPLAIESHPDSSALVCPPIWWEKLLQRFSPLPGPRWLWWTVSAGAIILWGVADIRLRGLPWPDRPLEHKTDFTVYTTAGRAFFTGENPYEVTNPRGWKYLYPPLFALLVAPLSLLPMAEQCLLWYFISVAFCWGCYREASRILKGFPLQITIAAYRISPQWLSFLGTLAFIAALFPTLNCLQRGQVGVLKLYLLLLGVRLVWQSATWMGQSLGGLALAGAIVLKLTPGLAVGMLLWAQLAAGLGARWGRKKSPSLPQPPEATPSTKLNPPHFGSIPAQHRTSSSTKPSPPPQALAASHPKAPAKAFPPSAPGALAAFPPTVLGVAVGLILFFFLLPASILGWQKNLEHLAYWANQVFPSAAEGFPIKDPLPHDSACPENQKLLPANYRTFRNQSLANAIFRFAACVDHLILGGPEDQRLDYLATAPNRIHTALYQTIQKTARTFLLGTLIVAGGMLGVWGGPLGQAAAFGLGCVGMLVISPVSWGHYFMLLAPAVLFVPLWLLERGRGRTALWMAGIPAALSILHYAFLDLAGRIGLLGIGSAGWLLAACVQVILFCRPAGLHTQTLRLYQKSPPPNRTSPLPLRSLQTIPSTSQPPEPKLT